MKIKSLFACSLASFGLLLAIGAAKPAAAQISVNIGVPPSCAYGYYDYAPYACAPAGFYGPGYFYNGIFLGVGPWYNWGYSHGWGGHRFVGAGGGRYVARGGPGGYRGGAAYHGGGAYHGGAVAHGGTAYHGGAVAHGGGGAPHAAVSHGGGGAPHAAAAHGGGGHAGGGHH